MNACDQVASREFSISPLRRAVPAIAAVAMLSLAVQSQFAHMVSSRRTFRTIELHLQMDFCLDMLFKLETGQATDVTGRQRLAAEKCIAILSPAVERVAFERWKADPDNRRLIEESVTRYPNLSIRELPSVRAELQPRAERIRSLATGPDNDTGRHFATTYALMAVRRLTWFGAIAAILVSALFGQSLLFGSLGIAVLTDDGETASRLRAAARACLAWAPLVGGTLLTLLTCPKPDPPRFVFGGSDVFLAFAPLLIAGATTIYAVANPARGFPERLTRTWLVRM